MTDSLARSLSLASKEPDPSLLGIPPHPPQHFTFRPSLDSPHGQVHPPEPWLLERWKAVYRAIHSLRHDLSVAAKSTPHVGVGRIRVEVPDVVRVHARFYDDGAVGEDSVW
jgi:hypothetical protein